MIHMFAAGSYHLCLHEMCSTSSFNPDTSLGTLDCGSQSVEAKQGRVKRCYNDTTNSRRQAADLLSIDAFTAVGKPQLLEHEVTAWL